MARKIVTLYKPFDGWILKEVLDLLLDGSVEIEFDSTENSITISEKTE